jgi:hypothetical protein
MISGVVQVSSTAGYTGIDSGLKQTVNCATGVKLSANFSGWTNCDSTSADAAFRIAFDGTQADSQWVSHMTSSYQGDALTALSSVLGAGSHTVEVQAWIFAGSNFNQRNNSTLIVLQLPQ